MDIDVIISYIYNVAPIYIYIIAFFFAYIENIFPPSPSDAVMVFIGYLIVVGKAYFLLVLLFSTLGSTLGYLTMYKLGEIFGDKVIEKGKLKFISLENIHKIERWFNRYGYGVVIMNRFLLGTRAVVSFFSGITHLNLTITTLLSAISAFAWNLILIYVGMTFGKQWRYTEDYLDNYAILITCLIGLVILFFVIKKSIEKRRNK